jgi:2-oxoglutarate ferredoxin oxidoreductase subunit beta
MTDLAPGTQHISLDPWKTDAKAWWCPGCGDYGVLAALQKALAATGLAPEEVVVVGGVGCSGRIGNWINTYGMHVTHGRALPVAMGIKIANPRLTVLAAGGDGDGFAIGMSHFMHACRRNLDVTYLVMDNEIYGLTKGQTSPTSARRAVTKSTPKGNPEDKVAPAFLALAAGATFVAQGFSGNQAVLTGIVTQALRHRGFAFVNVFSPCVTYNKTGTYEYYRAALHRPKEDLSPLATDRLDAMRLLQDNNHLLEGVLFQESSETLLDRIAPGRRPLTTIESPSRAQWSEVLARYK